MGQYDDEMTDDELDEVLFPIIPPQVNGAMPILGVFASEKTAKFPIIPPQVNGAICS